MQRTLSWCGLILMGWCLVTGGARQASAQPPATAFVLVEPGSSAYTWAVVAGGELKIDEDVAIDGSLRGNDDIEIKEGTSVTGDVTASGEVNNDGSVAGTVTEDAEPLALPAIPPVAELEALADRVLDGDQAFDDLVVDDVLLVRGKVEVDGALSGSGTLIVTDELKVEKGPVTLPPGEGPGLSIIVLDKVEIKEDQTIRGVLRAGDDVKLEKRVRFTGVIVADGKVEVKKSAQLTFVSPDQDPPEIAIMAPEDGATVSTPTPEIVVSFDDGGSGIDLASLQVAVDGTDISAGCSVDAMSASCPSPPLANGAHEVTATITDVADNEASAAASFEVAADRMSPVLFMREPQNQGFINETRLVLYNTTETDLVAFYRDDRAGDTGIDLATFSLTLDGTTLDGCIVGAEEARCPATLDPAVQHTFTARVSDLAGNLAIDFGTIDVVFDPDAPTVTLLEPLGPAPIYNDDFLPVAFTFADVGTGVDRSRIGVIVGEEEMSRFCRFEGDDGMRCQILGTFEGPQSLVVEVPDRAGNVGEARLDFVPNLDRDGPELAFASPTERAVLVGEDVLVDVRFSDPVAGIEPGSLRIRFDDEDITTNARKVMASPPAPSPHSLSAHIV